MKEKRGGNNIIWKLYLKITNIIEVFTYLQARLFNRWTENMLVKETQRKKEFFFVYNDNNVTWIENERFYNSLKFEWV